MKNSTIKLWTALLVIFFYGCVKSDGTDTGGTTNTDLDYIFIEDFSNGWTAIKGTPAGLYFITGHVTDSSKGKGIISGNLDESSPSTSVLSISGVFEQDTIAITISSDSLNDDVPPLADSTYTGIDDTLSIPHVLRLRNTAAPFDSLVLKQGS